MYLYLIQHGTAVNKEVNPERPLTEEGSISVKTVAHYMATHSHSPSFRI
jgi:phosphohistidine phosphatase SixA